MSGVNIPGGDSIWFHKGLSGANNFYMLMWVTSVLFVLDALKQL